MHSLLARASQLTLSFFSARQWLGTAERHMPARPRPAHDSPHTRGFTPNHRTGCAAQSEQPPERHACSAASGMLKTHPTRPVRVLRMREGTTERLAIVGRMADVCAELDRLAARERLC